MISEMWASDGAPRANTTTISFYSNEFTYARNSGSKEFYGNAGFSMSLSAYSIETHAQQQTSGSKLLTKE
jgi:hypothetical protein